MASASKQATQLGYRAEVDKARIEVGPALVVVVSAEVPERVIPVGVVECPCQRNL